MHIEAFRDYCLRKKGATEEFPFDNSTLVFKVAGKMFALTHIDTFESVNLKCDPMLAVELRERHAEVVPGYHMNKKHWNTVVMNGAVPDGLLRSWIDHSYALVVDGLPKKRKQALQ